MIGVIARLLILAWAGWWIFFGLASGLGEGLSPVGVFLHAALPGGVFLVTGALAWRWPTAGGALLILEGLVVAFVYPAWAHSRFPLSTTLFVVATMALPPIIAGLLLLESGHRAGAAPASGT